MTTKSQYRKKAKETKEYFEKLSEEIAKQMKDMPEIKYDSKKTRKPNPPKKIKYKEKIRRQNEKDFLNGGCRKYKEKLRKQREKKMMYDNKQ